MSILSRALIGLALASALAFWAHRARLLTRSGAWAAALVGTVACTAGWGWCAALLAFFLSSSLLSRWRMGVKERLTYSVVAKGGARDAWQVLANGGVLAVAAIGMIVQPSQGWTLVGLGSLAGATADTWATEIGTAIGGTPRALLGWHPVPVGTSGAITLVGTAAMCAGALFLGTVAALSGFPHGSVVPVVLGGLGGALVDTWLGATMQERRWCARCALQTERLVHYCGADTERRGGVAHLDNDVVNLTSGIAGAAIALAVGRLL